MNTQDGHWEDQPVMTRMERMLSDDVERLVDRLAGSIPEGALERIRTTTPTLRVRLDQVETNLAAVRASLVEGYGCWTRLLEDLENIWALAAWRATAEASADDPSRLAA